MMGSSQPKYWTMFPHARPIEEVEMQTRVVRIDRDIDLVTADNC
jgi:hypothetical protein